MAITLEELKRKAALIQVSQDLCEELGGHLWGGDIHWSEINYSESSSRTCVRCGQRRGLKEIDKLKGNL